MILTTLVLATNTGSLYMSSSQDGKMLVFASEKYILEQVLNQGLLKNLFVGGSITQVKAGQGYIVDLNLSKKHMFLLNDDAVENSSPELVVVKTSNH